MEFSEKKNNSDEDASLRKLLNQKIKTIEMMILV